MSRVGAKSGSGSLNKGKAYERKTAKMLSEWWTPYKFSRVPQSGAYRGANESEFAGDIATDPASKFPFVIECKHREGQWTLESAVLNRHEIGVWWQQVVGDARRVKRSPLLIFTRNYAEDFVMVPYLEGVYEVLLQKRHPVMRTVITYKDATTLKEESFDVLVTTFTGFSTLRRQYLIDLYTGPEWESYSLVQYTDEEIAEEDCAVESISNLLDKVKNL